MKRITVLAAVGLAMLYAPAAYAALINVDFGNKSDAKSGGVFSGAAAIGSDGDTWNISTQTASGTLSSLVDSTNTPTNASVSWSADQASAVTSWQWNALMEDYLLLEKKPTDGPGNTLTATVSGIAAGVYDLHLYGGTCRTSSGPLPKIIDLTVAVGGSTVGEVTLDSTSLEFDYVLGQNYGVFENVAIADGETLTITGLNPSTTSTASFNGFQLQEVPEPATMMLLLIGALGLAVCAWRKRK